MGTFTIKSQTISTAYQYKDEGIIVAGTYDRDGQTQEVKGISGNAYYPDEKGEQGQSIGNFFGSPDGKGGFIFSLSQMTLDQITLVQGAIQEIENNILGANAE